MKLYRIMALIERDMRKFFRSPALMTASMIFPLVQLVILGYAFGGKIRNASIGLVDHDHTVGSNQVHEMFDGIAAGAQTFRVIDYNSEDHAMEDLRAGFIRAVVEIPYDFSRRFYQHDRPQIALVEDNSDQFVSSSIDERLQQMVNDMNSPAVAPRLDQIVQLSVVEVYPYVDYIKYLLAGSIAMSIFIVAMIGGGITFIDDKSRGLHEGYLLTPIHKTELVLGLIGAGAIKGLMAGLILTVVGGLIAGIPHIWDPLRLFYLAMVVLVASLGMISFMFLVMVRVDDPLVPRAIFGVLNTLLFFPSGAVYPTEAFPKWLRWFSVVDPFTYTVDALRNLTVKSTGIEGIYKDVLLLLGFSAVMIAASIALFKRQI
ncbi:MAG TPA: ABC transporter permease [Candidatus Limnocylindrales bacterium]|nr:ABC transporter permease [Candidatus Limnocylindrales bacterium]